MRHAEIPLTLPIFPLAGAILLPRAHLPIRLFEPRYIDMIDDALKAGHRMIGLIQPLAGDERGIEKVGCIGRITQFAETDEDQYYVTLSGLCRFSVEEELNVDTAYRQVRITPHAHDFKAGSGEKEVDRPALITALKNYLRLNNMDADWEDVKKAGTETLINALSVMSPWGNREKQALLESENLKTRADLLIALSEKAIAMDKSTANSAPKMLQ